MIVEREAEVFQVPGISENSAAVYKNIGMIRDYTPSTHEISQIKADLQVAKEQCYTFKACTSNIISGMAQEASQSRKITYQEKALNAVKTVGYCALFLGATAVVMVATPFISLYFLLRTIARGEVFQQAENFSKVGQFIQHAYTVCNPDVETLNRWLDQGHTYRVKFYAHTQMLDPAAASLALVKACYHGDASVVRALIKAGNHQVNVANEDGRTPLFQAIEQGHQTLWPVLIQSGARVDVQDASGTTLLMKAIEKADVEAVKFLLANGAQLEGVSDKKGLSAKTYIECFIKNNPEHPQIIFFKSLIPAQNGPENNFWSYDTLTNYAYSYLQATWEQLKNGLGYETETFYDCEETFSQAQPLSKPLNEDKVASDDEFFDCGEEDTIFIQNT